MEAEPVCLAASNRCSSTRHQSADAKGGIAMDQELVRRPSGHFEVNRGEAMNHKRKSASTRIDELRSPFVGTSEVAVAHRAGFREARELAAEIASEHDVIASDLLEALQEVFVIGDRLVDDVYGYEFVQKAKAAIAKALGHES
jgi:hypothetical protein